MISTLLITIITEGFIALGYCLWRHKPVKSILLTSIIANLVTQSFLWGVLILFFQHYLIALLVSEMLIWIAESLALYTIPMNKLRFMEAISLGIAMNVVSFIVGLVLPV